MAGPQRPQTISTKQERIAKLAKDMPGVALTTLAHYIDVDWLREAYRRTRKDGAVGVDGQTAAEYAERLDENLQSLLDRAKSGTYRAPPVKRTYIPKGDGRETRPLGIPTFEDKVLQRAVTMVLEPIYEQNFLECSYGFRPGRTAHQALRQLWKASMDLRGGWVLDVDIRKYFDTLDRQHLRELLQRRVRDGVLLRLIGKWLNAGVLEDGRLWHPDAGTPQGGVISPLLANVFLHYVVDEWFTTDVAPRLRGRCRLIRYADDLVMVFELEDDAQRVWRTLPKRLGRFGLRLHTEKTRLVQFQQPARWQQRRRSLGSLRPGSFDFLGFRHSWRRTRRGTWVVAQTTTPSRLARAASRVWSWCKHNRHLPLDEQRKQLNHKLRGHYSYYGVTGNGHANREFYCLVQRAWMRWLSRRGGRPRTWEWFYELLRRMPLATPHVVHRWQVA